MDGKKDPGKFTVRFNLADPQQKEAANLLNRQGRFKAQFLTNAVLYYTRCGQVANMQVAPAMDCEQIKTIVQDILAQQQTSVIEETVKEADMDMDRLVQKDRDTIFRTLEAFSQQ